MTDIKNNKNLKKMTLYFVLTLIASVISSIGLHVFVYPANFVPLGLEAVVTLLYYLFPSINAGWFNLILNTPLIVYAFFKLDKKYVTYTLIFTILSSILLIVLELVSFPKYVSVDGRIISAIFAGVLLGLRTGIMIRLGSSTGGVDIIACSIQKKMQYINVERLISILCIIVIGISYFVYKDFNCILLALVQLFISEKVMTIIMRESREAYEVKIVTKSPYVLYDDIVNVLGHTATVIKSQGMYTNCENSLVITIINRRQLPQIISLSKKYPETFIYYTQVNGVYGKFRKNVDDIIN